MTHYVESFTDGKPWQKNPRPLTLQTAYNDNIIENYCAWPNLQMFIQWSLKKNTEQTVHAYTNVSFSLSSGYALITVQNL